MKSNVFFSDLKVSSEKTLLDKLDILLDRTHLKEKIREKDLVAIKLHFGERGNTAFVRPIFLRKIGGSSQEIQRKALFNGHEYALHR